MFAWCSSERLPWSPKLQIAVGTHAHPVLFVLYPLFSFTLTSTSIWLRTVVILCHRGGNMALTLGTSQSHAVHSSYYLEAHLSTGSHLQILLIVWWSAFLTMSPRCQLCDMGTLCHCYHYSWPSPGLVEPIWGWELILELILCQAQPRGKWRYYVSSLETIGSFPSGGRIISRSIK